MLRMPDGSTSVLAQGRRRVEIVEVTRTEPYYVVKARPVYEPTDKPRETEALMRAVLALFEKVVHLNRSIPEEAYVFAMNIEEPGWLADLVASTINVELPERQTILETFDPTVRLQRMSILLGKELDVLELEDTIHSRVQNEVDKNQREFYLREQMKAIQSELGETDSWSAELGELREKIAAAQMPDEVREKAVKEVDRLAQMAPFAPEVGIIRTYLDWLIELPWVSETVDNLDLKHAAALRAAQSQRAHPRVHGREAAGRRQNACAHSVLRRTAGDGQDLARQIHCRGARAQVRAAEPGRGARRGRDPRPPPDVHRRAARSHHPDHAPRRDGQPADDARRD
jgi:ATP-dependent Lon protease